jgi:hypothetical protein
MNSLKAPMSHDQFSFIPRRFKQKPKITSKFSKSNSDLKSRKNMLHLSLMINRIYGHETDYPTEKALP